MRFSCSQLAVDRLDPLVSTGSVPSLHLHQIVGDDSFNATMDPRRVTSPHYRRAPAAPSPRICSTTGRRALLPCPQRTYKRVPQSVTRRRHRGILHDGAGESFHTAFQVPGQELQGVPPLHAPDGRCEPLQLPRARYPDATGGFLRGRHPLRHHLPTCWDGRNTDSPNHRSHAAHPVRARLTHPIKIPRSCSKSCGM